MIGKHLFRQAPFHFYNHCIYFRSEQETSWVYLGHRVQHLEHLVAPLVECSVEQLLIRTIILWETLRWVEVFWMPAEFFITEPETLSQYNSTNKTTQKIRLFLNYPYLPRPNYSFLHFLHQLNLLQKAILVTVLKWSSILIKDFHYTLNSLHPQKM